MMRVVAAVSVIMAMVGFAVPAGSEGYRLEVPDRWSTLYESADGTPAGFPNVFSFRHNGHTRVLASYSQALDTPEAPTISRMLISDDGGRSFRATDADVGVANMVQLADGTLLGVDFKADSSTLSDDGHQVELVSHRSNDGGETWTEFRALFETDAVMDLSSMAYGVAAGTGMIKLPDNTLLMPYYTGIEGEPAWRVEVAASDDGGLTWERRGTIDGATTSYHPAEAVITRLPNGDLLTVFRRNEWSNGAYLAMGVARSSDNGHTWINEGGISMDDPRAPDPRLPNFPSGAGVLPALEQLPNGALVLSFGRYDNAMVISADGGHTWGIGAVTYQNYPLDASMSRLLGSSGYTDMAWLPGDRLLLTGDNCKIPSNPANPSCPTGTDWPVDDRYRIWTKIVKVKRAG